ncbi:MAG: preprotein translocase subunit SecE [Christensenellaceae bacterium]|jgi:preprotein translocase SecE subunit|nr:preprotein translocase subunit SecE [Christensenellaceae bacterium]
MKDKELKLSTPSIEATPANAAPAPAAQKTADKKAKQKAAKKGDEKKPFIERLKATLRGVISELKKVDWPPMKSSKNQVGALSNTSTVLVVTVIFLVLVTAINLGLVALFRLLINS